MPIAYVCLCTQFRQGTIDFLARNRALLDVEQFMRIAPEKTDHAILRVHGDAIAICVLLGRRDDWPHWNILKFADSLERITHLSPFDCKLMFVADVLVSASSASAEIRTLRRYAMRRHFLDFDQFRFGKLLFLADDFGRNDLALNSVRDKDSFAVFSRDALSAESDVFDS